MTDRYSGLLQALVNISGAFPAIFAFLEILFTFIGLLLFGSALINIYAYANASSGAHRNQASLPGIIWRFLVATIMTSSVWMLNVMQNTFTGGETGGGTMFYQAVGMSEIQKVAWESIMTLFMLLGYIAFGRGWMLLDKHFNGGKETIGSAITFIIAGTMLVFLEVWLEKLTKWTGFDFINILFF